MEFSAGAARNRAGPRAKSLQLTIGSAPFRRRRGSRSCRSDGPRPGARTRPAQARPAAEKAPPRSPLRGSLPPEGAFLPWGGPAAKKAPPSSPLRGSLPPEGAFLPWGGPAEKKPPTLVAARVAAPRGGVFALGRPGGRKSPHARRCAGRCPPRGRFCLGAARRQKKPHAVAWRQYDIWEPYDPVMAFILTNVAFKEPIQSQAATPRKA